MTITEFRDYSDPEFQASFRAYFAEIGITLRENTGVPGDHVGIDLTEDGKVFGFLQFQEETLTHSMGFFTKLLD